MTFMGLNDWNLDFLVVELSHSPRFLCKVTQAMETQARVAAAELGGASSVTTPVPEWPPEPTVGPRKAVSRSRGIMWAGNRHVGRTQPSRAAPDISGGSRHWGRGHSGLLIPKKHDSTGSCGPSPPALCISSSSPLTGLQGARSAKARELTSGHVNLRRARGLWGRLGVRASLSLSERRVYLEPQIQALERGLSLRCLGALGIWRQKTQVLTQVLPQALMPTSSVTSQNPLDIRAQFPHLWNGNNPLHRILSRVK